MTELDRELRVAAVQAAPIFLNREETTGKACDLIAQAAANGARFIVFPECFIPAFPHWFEFYPAKGPLCSRLNQALFRASVEVPSPTTDAIAAAARRAGAYVVMGINERRKNILGTMYNTQVFFGPDGTIIGKRRKLTPTMTERLVHATGDGSDLVVFPTQYGPVSGLICGENGNPLFRYALAAQGSRLHAAGWLARIHKEYAQSIDNMVLRARSCSLDGNHFGVHAAGIFTDQMCDVMELNDETRKTILRGGGSCIVGPIGQILAGPAGDEETILYADVDTEDIMRAKLRQDITGHYNRFDVVNLSLNVAQNLPLTIRSDGLSTMPSSKMAPASDEGAKPSADAGDNFIHPALQSRGV